jgi:hypothetical protein
MLKQSKKQARPSETPGDPLSCTQASEDTSRNTLSEPVDQLLYTQGPEETNKDPVTKISVER